MQVLSHFWLIKGLFFFGGLKNTVPPPVTAPSSFSQQKSKVG